MSIISSAGEQARESVRVAGGLVNRTEIGRGLSGGVSNQRVHHLTARSDFPEPLRRFPRGPVWLVADVEAWATANDRSWDVDAAFEDPEA